MTTGVITSMIERTPISVVLLGMRCDFTDAVAAQLIAQPISLAGGVIAMPELAGIEPIWRVPTADDGNIGVMGARGGLRDPGFRSWLEAINPDAIVVACFPWKLPAWLIYLPRLGCLNVHPSLLPDGWGPEPLFWAFRWDLVETGVTVHFVTEAWDSGPILGQESMTIPADATVSSLEHSLATIGGALARKVLATADEGTLVSTPQPRERGRYAPEPFIRDLTVTDSWNVDAVARFARAVIATYGPVTVRFEGTRQRCTILDVVSVQPEDSDAQPVVEVDDLLSIGFTGGRLLVRGNWPTGGE